MISLVLTQDKKTLINFGKFNDIVIEPSDGGGYCIGGKTQEHYIVLGRYSSSEMAKDVLLDLILWNNHSYELEREYQMPENKSNYISERDAKDLPMGRVYPQDAQNIINGHYEDPFCRSKTVSKNNDCPADKNNISKYF